MSKEILPCPFCGECCLDFEEGSTFRWLLARCTGCGATCGEVRVQTMGDGTPFKWQQQAIRDAKAAWNMRAIQQPVQPPDQKDIKTFVERCASHPDHQTGMVNHEMLATRLYEEIMELREFIEESKKAKDANTQ